jgi:hypothetical protein
MSIRIWLRLDAGGQEGSIGGIDAVEVAKPSATARLDSVAERKFQRGEIQHAR